MTFINPNYGWSGKPFRLSMQLPQVLESLPQEFILVVAMVPWAIAWNVTELGNRPPLPVGEDWLLHGDGDIKSNCL